MSSLVARRSRWIPWVFVAGFGVIVAANATMVLFAFGSWRGLATTEAYDKGRRYNHIIAERRQQEALGWEFAAGVEAKPGVPGLLRIELTGPDGAKVDGAAVTVELVRPASVGDDVTVVLDEIAPGRYQHAVTLRRAGLWELRISARRGEQAAVAVHRLVVK